MPRGGKRPGAGRPRINRITTKVSAYAETRDALNNLADEFDTSVTVLLDKFVTSTCFDTFKKFLIL